MTIRFLWKIWFLLTLLLPLWCAGADAIRLEPGTPLFAAPDPGGNPSVFVQKPVELVPESRQNWFLPNDFMVRRLDLYQLKIPALGTVYASPQIRCVPTENGVEKRLLDPETPPGDRLLQWGCGILAVLLTASLRFGNLPCRFWRMALIPVFWRSFLLISILIGGGNIYLFSTDEPDFFVTAADLKDGSIDQFWPRSFGTGIWYLPFALFANADQVMEILPAVSYCSAFLLVPAILILFFIIAFRFSNSRTALTASMILAVAPLFFFHYEELAKGIFQSVFELPSSELSFAYYQGMIWGGFNAMSDIPAALLLTAAAAAVLALPNRACGAVLGAGLLAAAALFRVNFVLFAPALAAAAWFRVPVEQRWKTLIFSGAAFSLIFAPQLVMNTLQLGSPLTFPYVRYEHTADGFRFVMLRQNVPLLILSNYPFFFAGTLGLWLIRKWQTRWLLALWIVPTAVFFFGYTHSCDDTIRFLFPVLGALILAAVLGFRDFLRDLPPQHAAIALLPFLLTLLLVAPDLFTTYPAQCWNFPHAVTRTIAAILFAAAVILPLAVKQRSLWLMPCAIFLYCMAPVWSLAFFLVISLFPPIPPVIRTP